MLATIVAGLRLCEPLWWLLIIGSTGSFWGYQRRETVGSKLLVASLVGCSRSSHGCTESLDGLPLLAFRQGRPAGKIMPPLSRSEKGVFTPSPLRKDPVSTAITTAGSGTRVLPPVLSRLLSGTFWLALRVPLQVVFALWTTRLVLQAIGPGFSGAYKFAWGFGFFQMLFEFGISSALQRQISDSWTRGDRQGVDRAVACGLNFYAARSWCPARSGRITSS